MMTEFTRSDQPPEWLRLFFEEIDTKRFGDGFDAVFLPDTELSFGTNRFNSFDEIKAHLQDFDSRIDTHHEVHEFWGSPTVNIFRGSIHFRPVAGGEEKMSQIVHVLHMDASRPDRVRRWHGAAGPGL